MVNWLDIPAPKYAQQVAGLGSGWQGTSATWADLNSSNAVQTRRMSLDAVDTVFARMGSDGSEAWYLADHLGSERGLMDNTGTLRDSINYNAFGNATESNPSYGDRFKWTGQEFDSSTKLQLNGMRYYDPATGRWTSQDPLGFGGGDSNLYRYASNSPVGNVDPTGMTDASEVFVDLFFLFRSLGFSVEDAAELATLQTPNNLPAGRPNVIPNRGVRLFGEEWVSPFNPEAAGFSETMSAYGRAAGRAIAGTTAGAAAGSATGAGTGAVVGGVATGGPGAVPGAIAGAGAGAMWGGISGFIAAMFSDNVEDSIRNGAISGGISGISAGALRVWNMGSAAGNAGNAARTAGGAGAAGEAGAAAAAEGEAAAAGTAPQAGGIVAQNGTRITGFTGHGVERAIGDGAGRAGTTPQAILDALRNPTNIRSGVDQLGRPFEIFTGQNARVVVNPGRIVSVNPLSGAGAH